MATAATTDDDAADTAATGTGGTSADADADLVAARDALFEDADLHGPRWRDLARVAAPAALLVVGAQGAAMQAGWRSRLAEASSILVADVMLVAPVLVAAVLLAGALAPLARTAASPLIAAGGLLAALHVALVFDGRLAAATVPAVGAGVLLGIVVARAVRRAVWALPLVAAAAASDLHSVTTGVTSDLLDGAGVGGDASSTGAAAVQLHVPPELVTALDYVVLHIPAASGMWLLGIVDIVAVGMLLGLAHLLWLPIGRTIVALVGALLVPLLVPLVVAEPVPIPVLPLLGLAWVLAHARLVWRATRFSLRRLTYLGG